VVVRNRAHFDILMKGLRDAGYEEPHSVERPYRELASSAMMEKPGRPRWDIFVRVVCRALRLDDRMLGRAKFHARLGKLKLYLMAAEDIFLFKSITDREGDLEDAALLARKGLVDWDVVLEELKQQERRGGRLFCIDVLQTLEILEERYGIRPPILRRVESHCLRQGLLSALKGGPKSMKQLKALVDFSDYQIYNALKALKNAGKVRTVRKDGLNYYAIRR
jgi:hypothetical protein